MLKLNRDEANSINVEARIKKSYSFNRANNEKDDIKKKTEFLTTWIYIIQTIFLAWSENFSLETALYVTCTIFRLWQTKTWISWFEDEIIAIGIITSTCNIQNIGTLIIHDLSQIIAFRSFVNTFRTPISPKLKWLVPIIATCFSL